MTNEVSSIIFEAAISKAFANRDVLPPSIEYFIQTGKVNGQFMLALKRLMNWVETKTIEAAETAMAAARQDEREKAGKLLEALKEWQQATIDFENGYQNKDGETTRPGIAALSFTATEKQNKLLKAIKDYEQQ